MRDDDFVSALQSGRPDPLAPGAIRLRQTARTTFRSVIGEASLILRVESGTKVLRGAGEAEIRAGMLALIPHGVAFDVENRPGPAGTYRATALVLRPDLPVPRGPFRAGGSDDPRALAAFERALDAVRHPTTPPALRDHATVEVLLWLAEVGLTLPVDAPQTIVERVRSIAGADLARDWRAAEIADALCISEATLRRRLMKGGTTLSALLSELRMTRALGLLQATERSVEQVAGDVGYASASRFAARFRARFGVPPRAIRAPNDRRGLASDRRGTDPAAAGC
jgi:AraC-like DNA-binding protein